MKSLIFILAVSFLFSGCGDKKKNTQASEAPRIPVKETKTTILNLKTGAGEKCIDFAPRYKVIVEGKEESVTDMFTLNKEDDIPVYSLANNDVKISDIGDSVKELEAKKFSDTIAKVIKMQGNKMIDYIVGGIAADGKIHAKEFNLLFDTVEIKYSVDCFGDTTSFHIVFNQESAVRLVYKQKLSGGDILAESRFLNDDGSVTTETGVMTIDEEIAEELLNDAKKEAGIEESDSNEDEDDGFFSWWPW
jgi:uncharacterized lipoprotein YehR (DUF1307 family)